jgi:hypothetical protein
MDSWMSAGAGRTGLSLSYVCRQHDAAVELYIDRGTDSEDDNLATLRMLQTHKDEIETDFGAPLEWQELEGKRACRVKGKAAAEGYRDESAWPQVVDAMVGAMIRLEAALRPHIASLP